MAAQQFAAHHQSLSGKTLAHYQILSLLGSGGRGAVYLAHDMQLNR